MQRDAGSWPANGTVPADEVEAIADSDMGENVEMPAGFLPVRPGRIPKAGARHMPGNARFEVADMDGNRIDNALVDAARKVIEKCP